MDKNINQKIVDSVAKRKMNRWLREQLDCVPLIYCLSEKNVDRLPKERYIITLIKCDILLCIDTESLAQFEALTREPIEKDERFRTLGLIR